MKNDLLAIKKDSPMEKVKKLVELQAVLKEIKPQIEALKEDLLAITQQLDVYTLKTGNYTISRAKKITPRVTDFKRLKQSLDEAGIPYMVEEVFTSQMQIVFKQALEDKKELEGLEGLITEYVVVRLPVKEIENEI